MVEEKIKVTEKRIETGNKVFLSRLKRKIFKHTLILRWGLIVTVLLVIAGLILTLARTFKDKGIFKYAHVAANFIFPSNEVLKSYNSRTNILILGKGGLGHEAPDLTDTIILMSISETKTIKTISLPRDIWITELRAKLNSTYYWGEQKEKGMGLVLAKSTVEDITGLPVHYAVVIDFSGFEKIVDAVGGIDVDVQNTFIDEKYPIAGKENDECGGDLTYSCRYEKIEFQKGLTHMDGTTALKFVRSRYSESDEGTDLARAARQELVVSALKNKILSKDVIFSPQKLLTLKRVMGEYLETDINMYEDAILARKIFNARKNVSGYVLPYELLENPPKLPQYDNLYVFIPRGGDWSQVKNWTSSIFKD